VAIVNTAVEDNAVKHAHENGLYTIVQSGKAMEMMEIMPVPEGFTVKEW